MFMFKLILCVVVLCLKDVQSGPINSTDQPVEKDAIDTHPNMELLPKLCGRIKATWYVFGGKKTTINQYPWMALISFSDGNYEETITPTKPTLMSRVWNDDSKPTGILLRSRSKRFDAIGESGDYLTFKCGGSIINSRYILTAAHCVIHDQERIGVRIGEHDYSRGEICQGEDENKVCSHKYQDVEVEEIIPHRGFLESNKTSHDIALLRVTKPMNLTNKRVGPICLPVTKALRESPVEGRNGTVAGWGRTESAFSSSVLREVAIPVKACDRDNSEAVLCAGEHKKDSCNGDSGGPLMIRNYHEGTVREIEYGIVSNGPTLCGSKGTYGVYTDVSKHMDWILDNIRP